MKPTGKSALFLGGGSCHCSGRHCMAAVMSIIPQEKSAAPGTSRQVTGPLNLPSATTIRREQLPMPPPQFGRVIKELPGLDP